MSSTTMSTPCWEVPARDVDAAEFFESLAVLCPEGSVLVIEGGKHSPDLRRFLEAHAVPATVTVPRGTVWPRSTSFHLPVSREILAAMASACENSAAPEVCDHLHVYQGEACVVQWYDAFSDSMWVSQAVPRGALVEFCGPLGLEFAEAKSAP
jgi:hypothetical protein